MPDDPQQYLLPEQTFDDFFDLWRDDLRHWSASYARRYAGRANEEGVNETFAAMSAVWWNSLLTWDEERGPFGPHFHRCWVSHYTDTVRRRTAAKRPQDVVSVDPTLHGVSALEVHVWDSHELLELVDHYAKDDTERLVVLMLAMGYTATDIKGVIGRRKYEAVRKAIIRRMS